LAWERVVLKDSPYAHLLDDPDFKRWIDNVRRGSATYGYEMLRRMGYVEKRWKKSPKDFTKMKPKEATNFILDLVSELENEKKSGSYISNIAKAIRSWLDYNGIQLQQKIKISNRDDLTKFGDERPPTQQELKEILNAGDLRVKTACVLVAFSGVRIEVLGNYLGDDGLRLKDLPELHVKGEKIEFEIIPAMVLVRKSLSKTKRQYFTFLPEEGCDYLRQQLELRIRQGEKLTPDSPVITPTRSNLRGDHIRSTNVGDLMRKAIRKAGFQWRPYVLRRYFDTRLMLAESDGLIIHDWRVFFMGHKGNMEATYTVNKALPKDAIEKMRESYANAAAKYLQTIKPEPGEDKINQAFKRQLLAVAGYTEQEIAKYDLAKITDEELHGAVRKRLLGNPATNGSKQKVVGASELDGFLEDGWEYVAPLSRDKIIIRTSAS
jgi:hypothetical protein